jgi:hypothetical protein
MCLAYAGEVAHACAQAPRRVGDQFNAEPEFPRVLLVPVVSV